MKYALSENGVRIKATKHSKGFCDMCGKLLIPKCGEIYDHYWAHKTGENCDSWSEHESDWHKNWKNLVDEQFQERPIEKNGVKHRADICLVSGIVVELQHSTLSPKIRCERETFYERMIWIIHLPNAKIEKIRYCYEKNIFADYYVKIKNINEWIYRPPHSSPIFLDLDDDYIFHITEFANNDSPKTRTRFLYGNFIERKKFIRFFEPTFFDFDLKQIEVSQRHSDFFLKQLQIEEKQRLLREERERENQEKWRKKKEEEWRIEQEEVKRKEQERNDPKKREELRIVQENAKWGLIGFSNPD
jgi:hypothetical protein